MNLHLKYTWTRQKHKHPRWQWLGISISYVVMRVAYVGQWVRVLRAGHPTWRRVARRIIVLTTAIQAGWVLFLFVPLEWRVTVFVIWFAADVATPIVSGWDARMGGHSGHIVERYGLFTIIVLGESIAAATIAVGHAITANVTVLPLLTLAAGGLVMVLSVWWLYFDFRTGRAPSRGMRSQYLWAYGHYFLFAAIAAMGAGLSLSVDWLTDPGHVALTDVAVAMVVGGAVAALLLTIGAIEFAAEGDHRWEIVVLKGGGAAFAVVSAFAAAVLTVPGVVLLIGLMLAGIVVYGVTTQHRLYVRSAHEPARDEIRIA